MLRVLPLLSIGVEMNSLELYFLTSVAIFVGFRRRPAPVVYFRSKNTCKTVLVGSIFTLQAGAAAS